MHTKLSYNVVFIAPAVKVQDKRLLCCSDLLMTNSVIVCAQVSGISGSMLETVFKQRDPQGTLLCNIHLNSSHPVFIVQTTGGGTHSTQSDFLCVSLSLCLSHLGLCCCPIAEAGFLGLLSGLPQELQQVFPVTTQQHTESSAGLSRQNNFLTIKTRE